MIDIEVSAKDSKAYPQNLLAALTDNTDLVPPKNITADLISGLSYALSLLDGTEREVIQLRYSGSHTPSQISILLSLPEAEICLLERKALTKLRTTPKWNYIKYGIVGNLKRISTEAYSRGYTDGYKAGYKSGKFDAENGMEPPKTPEETLNPPIETMGISVRAFNCLKGAGCVTIGDVAQLNADRIWRMRSLGKVSADEIAHCLQKQEITGTAWDSFLMCL